MPIRWQIQIVLSNADSFIPTHKKKENIDNEQENYIVRYEKFQTEKGTQRTKNQIQEPYSKVRRHYFYSVSFELNDIVFEKLIQTQLWHLCHRLSGWFRFILFNVSNICCIRILVTFL